MRALHHGRDFSQLRLEFGGQCDKLPPVGVFLTGAMLRTGTHAERGNVVKQYLRALIHFRESRGTADQGL
ncbi:hypothetical protein FQZ97_1185890 [compost metagenome]